MDARKWTALEEQQKKEERPRILKEFEEEEKRIHEAEEQLSVRRREYERKDSRGDFLSRKRSKSRSQDWRHSSGRSSGRSLDTAESADDSSRRCRH